MAGARTADGEHVQGTAAQTSKESWLRRMTLPYLCKHGFLNRGDIITWRKSGTLRTATVRHDPIHGWVLATIDSENPVKSWYAWTKAVDCSYGELPKHSTVMRGDDSTENLQDMQLRAAEAGQAAQAAASATVAL